MKLQKVNRKHVSYVELERDGKTPIGLSIKDGAKYGLRPLIKNIKAQSLSHRSHCVAEGDVVLSLCGEDSKGLSKKDVRRRLKEAPHSRIELTLQYESREPSFDNYGVYRYEKISLKLRKESGSFGFILRKNDTVDSASSEYPTITNIRHGGPADKEKCLQDGDRLLKIDDQSLSWLSLSEVSSILKEKQEAVFLVEYNVRIVDYCKNVGVRTEVEVDCLDDLGMILGSATQGSKLLIQEIRRGSLAQRCGAFKQGDVIERINDIDTALLTSSKAKNLLERFRKESGKLVFIPIQGGQGLQDRLNPNAIEITESRKRCNASYPSKASHPINHYSKIEKLSKGRTQLKHTSSPDSPLNIPSSSNKRPNFPENTNLSNTHRPISRGKGSFRSALHPFKTPDYQNETLSMLTDMVRNISKLGSFVSYFDNEVARASEMDQDSLDASNKSCIEVDSFMFSQMKSVYTETKLSAYSLALNVTQHHKIFPWDVGKPSDFYYSGKQQCNVNQLLQQVTNTLLELERKKMLPSDCVAKLKSRLDAVKINCKGCHDFCLSTLHLMQKFTLLLSFDGCDQNSQKEVCSLLEKVRNKNISCDDCRKAEQKPNSKKLVVRNIPPEQSSSLRPPVSCKDHLSSGNVNSKSKLNQLSNNSETASGMRTGTSNSPGDETTGFTSESDLNIKEYSSVLKPTNTRLPPKSNANEEPNPKENRNNLVNYHSNSNSKIHKEKNCFQMTFDTSNSDNILSSDENEMETHPVARRSSNVSNHSTTSLKRSASSSIFLEASSLNGPSSEVPRNPHGSFTLTSSDKWETTSECLSSVSRPVLEQGLVSNRKRFKKVPLKTRSTVEVVLKDEGFGLGLDVEHTTRKGVFREPHISYIHSLGAAKKCGIIRVGDKVLEVNGLDLEGLPASLLDSILPQSLKAQEVKLKVQFEVATPEFKEGTFDVRLEKALKCGIIFEGDSGSLHSRFVPDIRKGAPLKVKGIVAGSAAHRSGLLHPGDEVLAVKSVKEESFETIPAEYKRQDFSVITVVRGGPTTRAPSESGSEMTPSSLRSLIPSPPFIVHRSMVRPLKGKKGHVIDHDLTLYRDFKSTTDRFGFSIKQNHSSGNVYISKLRSGGPADTSKVIQIEDRILEINGTIIGRNNKSYVIEKFKEDNDFIDLVTRRILL